MDRTRVVLGALVGLPLAALAVWGAVEFWPHEPPPALAAPRSPTVPDLTMTALTDFLASIEQDGTKQQLFFTASIANIGAGPFMVHAVRGDERGKWRISQRFRESDGTTTEMITPGALVWGGHGHNHWHVQLGATYEIRSLEGELLRRHEKVGYCFFDQAKFDLTLPQAPKTARFPKDTCSDEGTLALDMGLSPGWQDPYTWALPDQRVDITGLPDGEYRLRAKADPGNWFRESDESNNVAWADVRLTTSVSPPRVEILRSSPPQQD
jgi:hypothetical protein